MGVGFASAAWLLVDDLWEITPEEPIEDTVQWKCAALLPSVLRDHIAEIVENPDRPARELAFVI
jgi:hypothetical protein